MEKKVMRSMLMPILNREYVVDYSKKAFLKERVVKTSGKIVVFPSVYYPSAHKKVLKSWLKEEARKVINKRAEKFSDIHGFQYNKIAIKDQSTIWGSCSSRKNLNFSWRLVLAPLQVLDYVVIHELAHTKEMNHSQSFWEIVEECMPRYNEHKEWLKYNGRYLKRVV